MKKSTKIILSIAVFLAVALVTVLPTVHVCLFTVPREAKADRVSQGVIPTAAVLSAATHYERVVVLGVDGAGDYFGRLDTPQFDRIFGEGSVRYGGMAQYPTISAPNWAAMLLGVTAQTHQITNDKAKVYTRRTGALPSVFATVAEADPTATFFSAVAWTAINHGIIEADLPAVTKWNAKDAVHTKDDYLVDAAVADAVVARLDTHDDAIVFCHFDQVDHAGHSYGHASPQYAEAIRKADGLLGRIYDAYQAKGLLATTLFVCVSDHGHTEEGGHGKESAAEKAAMLAVAGGLGDVIAGQCGPYVTHDLAPVILSALGVAVPAHYEGGVPTHLFTWLA